MSLADEIGDVPASRVRDCNVEPVRRERDYVLYWMIAARRSRKSFALDRAIGWAQALDKPLVVFEPLRVAYEHASARLHRFVIDGMADNARAFGESHIRYFPYVEPTPGAGKGLLQALASRACIVVTDDWPCFFLPRMVSAASQKLDVRLEAIDGNGLLPLAASPRPFTAAVHFRRHLQRTLPEHFARAPSDAPLSAALPSAKTLPKAITERWPAASSALLRGDPSALAALPIDHGVPVVATRGGSDAAQQALARFIAKNLSSYTEQHNAPSADATSRLSPYLHFGHIGAHEVFAAVAKHERWTPKKLGSRRDGGREGFYGMSAAAEAFLDQLVTWRELGFVFSHHRPHDYTKFSSLPDWAKATLEAHHGDPRPHLYDRTSFEEARTHDPLWNAAQRQLLREGWQHNYMRMLWGKKILEWSKSPEQALATMIAVMDRWALDGRDPNSYSGYFWCLGRFDRPWPERKIYGTVRSMSSENTAKKVDVKPYLSRYGP